MNNQTGRGLIMDIVTQFNSINLMNNNKTKGEILKQINEKDYEKLKIINKIKARDYYRNTSMYDYHK